MKELVKRFEVWIFLFLIVVANALFIYAIHIDLLPRGLYNYGRFAVLGSVMFIVVFYCRGLSGVLGLLKPFLVWRISPLWFLLALSWSLIVAAVFLLGKGWIVGDQWQGYQLNTSIVQQPRIMATVVIGSFIGEIVWVSYAISRLSRTMPVFSAAMVVGTFWTLWWLPMAILNIGIIPGLKLAPMLVNMLGVAAICGWFYHHTKSGLCVLCLQIMVNTSLLLFPLTPTVAGATTYWAYAVTYLLVACAAYVFFGPKPMLFRPGAVKYSAAD